MRVGAHLQVGHDLAALWPQKCHLHAATAQATTGGWVLGAVYPRHAIPRSYVHWTVCTQGETPTPWRRGLAGLLFVRVPAGYSLIRRLTADAPRAPQSRRWASLRVSGVSLGHAMRAYPPAILRTTSEKRESVRAVSSRSLLPLAFAWLASAAGIPNRSVIIVRPGEHAATRAYGRLQRYPSGWRTRFVHRGCCWASRANCGMKLVDNVAQ